MGGSMPSWPWHEDASAASFEPQGLQSNGIPLLAPEGYLVFVSSPSPVRDQYSMVTGPTFSRWMSEVQC